MPANRVLPRPPPVERFLHSTAVGGDGLQVPGGLQLCGTSAGSLHLPRRTGGREPQRGDGDGCCG